MPYTETGAVYEDDLLRQAAHVLDVGCQGFVIGQVSEVLRLTTAERMRVAELSAAAAAGRGVSVMSTGAESAEAAIELSRHAEAAGVDALLVMHPATQPLTDEEMHAYFAAVVEAVGIPVLVHHAKSLAKEPMTIGVQARLLDAYGPERVMFKPEAAPTPPRVSLLRDATGGRARIFEGEGGMVLLDTYRRGLTGTIPATEIAEIVVALWARLDADDRLGAERLGHPLAYLMCHMMASIDAYASMAKHLLHRRGLISSTAVRGPVRYTLDPETRAEVEHTYDELLALTKETLP
jgi:4-hydroxy-tetrahydrodipicolinate synthase